MLFEKEKLEIFLKFNLSLPPIDDKKTNHLGKKKVFEKANTLKDFYNFKKSF